MKTKTQVLKFSKYTTGAIVSGIAILFFAFAMVVVHAQVLPTVDTSIHNGSHGIITSVPIGTMLHDSVTVASTTGPTPTGTVDFNLYQNTTCSGTPATQLAVALVSGTAESATTTVGSSGLSYRVHYNGQGDLNVPADGICEPLTVTAPAPTISTTLSTTTAILAGSLVYDSSTLGSATANATGTVAYNVYTDNSCTLGVRNAGTKTVVSGVIPNSDSLQFNTAGTFYWQAVYSGDLNNAAATSTCQSEVLTVVISTTPTPGAGSIAGEVYNDLNRSRLKDAGEFGLSGWTINLYKGSGWWGKIGKDPFMTTVSDTNGNYAFNNLPDGTYSIEEINQKGWIQLTSDYNKVILTGGVHLTGFDFGNASTTSKNNGRFCGFFGRFDKHFKHFKHCQKLPKHFGNHGNGNKKEDDNDRDD